MNYLSLEKRNEVAIVWMDRQNEKMNTLDRQLVSEFPGIMKEIEHDEHIKAVVLASKKEDNFIAGADLNVLSSFKTKEDVFAFTRPGNELLNSLEHFKKPIVAAIHGACLGGGLEVALACDSRVCTDSSKTKFGLPEVKLGLLPGGGGTQRLPRLIGLQKSLDIMLTGKNVYPRQAKRMGLVDVMVHKHALIDVALEHAKKLIGKKIEKKDLRSMPEKLLESTGLTRGIIYSQAKKMVMKQTLGNYPAPLKILDCIKTGMERGFYAGQEAEISHFAELVLGSESKALVNLFFGMTEAKKNPWAEHVKPVKKIGMLGAGLMGSGIAQVSAENGGYEVILKDRDLESAAKGYQSIYKDINKKTKKRIIKKFEEDQVMARIQPSAKYSDFKAVDVVIEAVFEDINVKHSVLKECEAASPEHMIFASNTSSLPITDIAKGSAKPEQVVGMHYFSPVQKMPLLEIIKTEQTADWVTGTAYEIGNKQGKTNIVVNDGPGFYTTRILAPYMNEALVLLEEGAKIEDVEKAMKLWGFPVGPMALFDEVGIDVAAHINDVMGPFFAKRGMESTSVTKDLYNAGFFGRKSKKGFYLYEDDKKKKEVNTGIYSYFGGSNRKSIDFKVIQERMGMMMVNEALWCLHDNILLSAKDGDLGAILGLGFPPFKGGPFFWIDTVGADTVLATMQKLEKEYGTRFKPCPILEEYAKAGKKFYA
ncbi:fatty acid oxidation complex subunit alpha FadJ [bacterium]|nr:MAG: fatty acid oxidation complex subunit alpha FadJ [bacterium]